MFVGSDHRTYNIYIHPPRSLPAYENPFRNEIPDYRASTLDSDRHHHDRIPADENDGQSHSSDEEPPENATTYLN